MQKFAKTAAMSNFLRAMRCPNDFITVCIFACRLNVSSKIDYIKHLFVLLSSRNQKKICWIISKLIARAIQKIFAYV